jgi:hypothetical protein
LKDWFRWMTKQDVLMHNPASELELPRMEKRPEFGNDTRTEDSLSRRVSRRIRSRGRLGLDVVVYAEHLEQCEKCEDQA